MQATSIDLHLTATEQRVLDALLKSQGNVISRADIAKAAEMRDVESNVLEVIVSRLRLKLKVAKAPLEIVTRRGFGYGVKQTETAAA